MRNIRSHLRFNRQERSGIFILFCLLLAVQLTFYLIDYLEWGSVEAAFHPDTESQALIDSLLAAEANDTFEKIRVFNPNFISDYKGYTLGMTPDEIDRLHHYRDQGMYVNTVAQFQEVTGIGDSLLNAISVYFQFPEWKKVERKSSGLSPILKKKDLNSVNQSELIKIRGIGKVLSERIVKFRDALGGFLEDNQLYDVYGLEERVVKRVLEEYTVIEKPEIELLDLNKATAEELYAIAYISRYTARDIIRYRDSVGLIESLDELQNIPQFPAEKIKRIKLYLTL